MKKALVAGAASAVLAAMPVVGVFAVGNGENIQDKIQLRIGNTCDFSITTGTGNGHQAATSVISDGAWGTGATADTYTGTVTNGQSYTNFASTKFLVKCNDAQGYQVTVSASEFEDTAVSNKVPKATYPWNYVQGAALVTDGDSMWTISSDHANQTLSATSGSDRNTVAAQSNSLGADGETFTVSYSAFVDSAQPAAVYQATATYTFAQL